MLLRPVGGGSCRLSMLSWVVDRLSLDAPGLPVEAVVGDQPEQRWAGLVGRVGEHRRGAARVEVVPQLQQRVDRGAAALTGAQPRAVAASLRPRSARWTGWAARKVRRWPPRPSGCRAGARWSRAPRGRRRTAAGHSRCRCAAPGPSRRSGAARRERAGRASRPRQLRTTRRWRRAGAPPPARSTGRATAARPRPSVPPVTARASTARATPKIPIVTRNFRPGTSGAGVENCLVASIPSCAS